MTNLLITPAQTDLINRLRSERVLTPRLVEGIAAVRTRVEASFLITSLIAAPKQSARPAPGALQSPEQKAYFAALRGISTASSFAIPVKNLTAFTTLRLTGDLLFLEVRDYGNRRYFNRLTGAPGSFNRTRVGSLEEQTALLLYIAGRELEFATLFGQHFTICGKCRAPLTDPESRARFLGPVCAGRF